MDKTEESRSPKDEKNLEERLRDLELRGGDIITARAICPHCSNHS